MEFFLSKIDFSRVAGAWELKSNLDQLRDSLPSVNYLMEKAEWWRFKNPNIARLLVQLQDAAYDAEDITSQLLSSFVSFIKNVVNNSGSKVTDVHAKLNSISAKLEREIGPLSSHDGQNHYGRAMQRPTSSINPEKVFGRENELEMVVKLMIQGDWAGCSSNYELSDSLVGRGKRKRAKNISILPIVGSGGVGKTTLAQLIYNDARVKTYFDLKIWVCVSDYFDLKRVTKEMIESANIELSKKGELRNNERELNVGDSLESLQQTLQGKVESKRCLIVLDDIWHEQSMDFEILCNPLRSGLQGSMILITTRLRNVAEVVGNRDPMELGGLPGNIYWDLFKKCAFGSLDPSSFPELEDIGKKIADRLKGSPLAAKTLGGILHVNMTTRQWRNILNSELWQIEQADGDILPALRVSYQYLPIHLKRCFLICSLFPKDHRLYANLLSPIWMSDGIIPHHEKYIFGYKDNKGEEYFRDIESRCFVLRGQDDRLSLHDHMHDLAKSLSHDTCYCQEDNKWDLENHLSIRHLSLYHKPIELIDTEIGKCKKLRSLLFLDGFNSEIKLGPSTLASLFDQLPYLRVLDLEMCQIQELPDNIGKLKLLFYINLSYTKIRSLPESICQLYNLQVVNVEGCPLESFPKMFHNLINLRLITEMMEISSLIPGIGKLTSLEKLPEFKVLNKDGHKVEELKNMTRLRGDIKISNLENVESRGDASQACLNNKEYLTSLTLSWSPNRIEDTVKDGIIIEGLEPHSNLQRLHIKNYGGITPASWMQTGKLSFLQHFTIEGCSNLVNLEDWFVRDQLLSLRVLNINDCVKLASLPFEWIANSSLSWLVIKNCPLLSCPSNLILPCSLTILQIDSCGELDKLFPSCLQNVYSLNQLELHNCHYVTSLPILSNHLKKLKLTNCAELQYLNLANPSILEILDILKCPKLMQSDPLRTDNKAPTERIKHLRQLHIDNTSLLKLPFLLCPPCSLDQLIVWNSPEEKMFRGDVHGWLSRLQNLEQLIFTNCSNLESLPEELHTLKTLKRIQIRNCPKILSLPKNGLPPSVNYLYFPGCHPVLTEQLEKHEIAIMKGERENLQRRSAIQRYSVTFMPMGQPNKKAQFPDYPLCLFNSPLYK
ncbi:putative disease resistance protein RGA1 [Carex littledalei]|uniref:Putative disease resistance protein RGA1 n=1 Tax=Carex littledalei TaxID=544730 RepID=A0A833QTI5_9POAL|nr:putative disease resistance protein RGA1 [Carex littledalei]